MLLEYNGIRLSQAEKFEAERVINKYTEHQCGFIPKLMVLKNKCVELERTNSIESIQKIQDLCDLFLSVSNEYAGKAYVNEKYYQKMDMGKRNYSPYATKWLKLASKYEARIITTYCGFTSINYAEGKYHAIGKLELKDLRTFDTQVRPFFLDCLFSTPVEMFFLTKIWVHFIVLDLLQGMEKKEDLFFQKAYKIHHSVMRGFFFENWEETNLFQFKYQSISEKDLQTLFYKFLFSKLAICEAAFREMLTGKKEIILSSLFQ